MNWNSCTPKECLCWKIKLMKKYLPPASETSRMINETQQCGEQTHLPLGLCFARTTMLLFSFVAVFLAESGEETEVFPRPCTPLALTPAVPKPTPNHWGLKMAWLGLRVSNFRLRMPDWTVSTWVLDMLEETAGWGVRGLLTSGCSWLDSGRAAVTCWRDEHRLVSHREQYGLFLVPNQAKSSDSHLSWS